MGKREHFWQQVILIEIFQIVNLVQGLLILLRHFLNLVKDFLIIDKTRPKLTEVVLTLQEVGRPILDLSLCGRL